MVKVGITGGIGSGKTTVCKVFEVLGIPVFYADAAAKELMQTDAVLASGIVSAFGKNAYTAAGQLDRKYLADVVFNDGQQLDKLNALVHPAVYRAFDRWALLQDKAPYVLKEAALLFESGSYKMCDKTILVTAPAGLKIQRIITRDHISEAAAAARMNKQFTDEQKLKLADLVLANDEKELLLPRILKFHDYLLSLS